MIIEIQIPDEIYEQYGKSIFNLEQRLRETAGMDIDPTLRAHQLSSEQLAELRRHFGPNIKDSTALLNLIRKVGTIRLQEAVFTMDSDQIEGTINQAYFERQALLRAIEAEPAETAQGAAARYKLRLRADELAAGLDGWTGGWFGKQAEGNPRAHSVD